MVSEQKALRRMWNKMIALWPNNHTFPEAEDGKALIKV